MQSLGLMGKIELTTSGLSALGGVNIRTVVGDHYGDPRPHAPQNHQ